MLWFPRSRVSALEFRVHARTSKNQAGDVRGNPYHEGENRSGFIWEPPIHGTYHA